MPRAPQWNVKGVDDTARLVARDAAAKAGMPIGAWVGRAVLRRAREERRAIPPSTTPVAVEDAPAPIDSVTPLVGPAPERVGEPSPPPGTPTGSAFGRWPRVALAAAIMVVLAAAAIWLVGETVAPPDKSTRPAPQQVAATPPTPTPTTPAATTTPEPSPIEALRQAATGGDARAQYDLGVRYASGRDVPKDDVEAARWFERAAVQGYASAQYNLGVLYDRGMGVKQDDTLAFFWYQSAAEQNHPRAQHNLATAYADGKGTNQDMATAAKWFEKAANTGIPESQFYLGAIYERGLSVQADPARALALYRQAAAQGHREAAERMALIEGARATAQPTRVPQPEEFTAAPATGAPLPRPAIAEIQRLLARLDFDPGPADGVIGRKTNQAIASYQSMAGMRVDGIPSAALLDELREVAGAARR